MPALTTILPAALTDKLGEPFEVRSYDPADRPAIEAMYRAFDPKRAAQGLPPEREPALRRWLDRVLGQGVHTVVEVGGLLLGHAMLIPMENGGAELANFLHQSIRNRGIGTAVNRVMVLLARQHGFRYIWLSVEPSNRAAVRSYEKVGFRLLPGSLWASEIEMQLCLGDA